MKETNKFEGILFEKVEGLERKYAGLLYDFSGKEQIAKFQFFKQNIKSDNLLMLNDYVVDKLLSFNVIKTDPDADPSWEEDFKNDKFLKSHFFYNKFYCLSNNFFDELYNLLKYTAEDVDSFLNQKSLIDYEIDAYYDNLSKVEFLKNKHTELYPKESEHYLYYTEKHISKSIYNYSNSWYDYVKEQLFDYPDALYNYLVFGNLMILPFCSLRKKDSILSKWKECYVTQSLLAYIKEKITELESISKPEVLHIKEIIGADAWKEIFIRLKEAKIVNDNCEIIINKKEITKYGIITFLALKTFNTYLPLELKFNPEKNEFGNGARLAEILSKTFNEPKFNRGRISEWKDKLSGEPKKNNHLYHYSSFLKEIQI
ncbi:hypothetical protein [Gaetbulibacter jejuensis]|uniref:Uncharacterized protein n=1 Tax=Gaetbulibacter jejuensis TaxID=584607 RepID=A0ABP3V6X8_9FLAO